MHPATRPADAARLHERIMVLAREKHALAEEVALLRRALAASMLRYTGHTALTVGGLLTVVLNSGETYQRAEQRIDRPGEAGFEYEWVRLEPVPESPAARIAEADDMPASFVAALERAL